MKCPRCGLINPESAQRCDCGYDFQSQTTEKSYLSPGRLHDDLGQSNKEPSARVRMASEAQPLPKMWIGILMGITFLALELIEGAITANHKAPSNLAIFIWLFGILIWLYWLYCVFKIHDAVSRIPGYRHPITPAGAVGRHFIPFYNLYWIFKWPSTLANFVNWRMQAKKMHGWIAGILVLLAVLTFRFFDGFVGTMLLFGSGAYISMHIKRAFAAPPIPESAMASPVGTNILGL